MIVRYCLFDYSIDFRWYDDIDEAKCDAAELPHSELVAYSYESFDSPTPFLIRKVHVTHRQEN